MIALTDISEKTIQAYDKTHKNPKLMYAIHHNGPSNTPLDFSLFSATGNFYDVVHNFDVTINTDKLMYGWAMPIIRKAPSDLYARVSQLEYKTNGRTVMPVQWFELVAWKFKEIAHDMDTNGINNVVDRKSWFDVVRETDKVVENKQQNDVVPIKSLKVLKHKIIKAIRSGLEYKLDYPLRMPCGMLVTHCIEGACGSRLYYRVEYNKEGEPVGYECYIYLTQTLIDTWTHKKIAEFVWLMQIEFINRGHLKCIRCDVRIDDPYKMYFIPSLIMKAASQGNFKGCKQSQLITDYKGGWTQYFGSPKSSARLRFYETYEKHGYYGIRCERQYRGDKASVAHFEVCQAWGVWQAYAKNNTSIEGQKFYLKHMANLTISGFEITEDWWSMIKDRIGFKEINFSIIREKPTLNKRGGWIKKVWQNTLAILSKGLGYECVMSLCNSLIEQGERGYKYLSSGAKRQHDIMVQELQNYGLEVLGYNSDYKYEYAQY